MLKLLLVYARVGIGWLVLVRLRDVILWCVVFADGDVVLGVV